MMKPEMNVIMVGKRYETIQHCLSFQFKTLGLPIIPIKLMILSYLWLLYTNTHTMFQASCLCLKLGAGSV